MAKKQPRGKFEADLIKTYHQISGKPKKSRDKAASVILIGVVSTCLIIAFVLTGCLYISGDLTPGQIVNNVSILGVDVGGMSKADATSALQTAFDNTYSKNTMIVTIDDRSTEISTQSIGMTLDTKSAVKAAYDVGRTGSQANRKLELTQAVLGGIQVDATDFLLINETALMGLLEEFCSNFPAQPIDGTWELIGERPDLSAEEVPANAQQLKVNMGRRGYEIDLAELSLQVHKAFGTCVFEVNYACKTTEPIAVDLDKVYEEVCTEPVEAVMDPNTFEVSEHAYGYTFDLEKAKNLQKTATEAFFEVSFSPTAPTHTKQGLESVLFRDVLGTYKATSGSQPGTRDVNLKLACEKINGVVLMPGDVFKYNPTLGERTPEAGWQLGDAYAGSVTRKEYGGGICQVSSTLYLSALLADLEIVERHNHGFISSYVPFGMDATVSWGGPDFHFKNSTDYPLRIEAWASGGSVTVQLVGTDTKDYYIKMTYDVLSYDPYKTVYEEMEEDNKKGYKDGDVITSAYSGYRIRTYRCKYSKATDELISSEEEVTSTYSRRDLVICKIKTEDSTEATTESTTEATTEPPTEAPTEAATESPTEETTASGETT